MSVHALRLYLDSLSSATDEGNHALELWREGGSYRGFSDVAGQEHEDAGFRAGFEAGYAAMRDRVLGYWDANDSWIPGAGAATFSKVLGVEPKRLRTHRFGGESRPGRDMP